MIHLFYPHREIMLAQRRERIARWTVWAICFAFCIGFWWLVFREVAKSLDR